MMQSRHLWGWQEFFSKQMQVNDRDLWLGRVIEVQRDLCRVVTGPEQGETRECWAAMPGRLRHALAQEWQGEEDLPAVGDWLLLEAPLYGDGTLRIQRSLARRSVVKRARPGRETAVQVLAANVDKVLIVSSLNQDFNVRRLERYLIMAWDSGAVPLIVLTKTDLGAEGSWQEVAARLGMMAAGVATYGVSAVTGEGMATLANAIASGETAVLVGSSGVGKSTLTNALLGMDKQVTQTVRAADDRGRHTTTARCLFRLPHGALLIDTPGIRELALWDDAEGDGLAHAFADLEALKGRCRFSNCQHQAEPGCAIQAALADGSLDAGRWVAYGKLQKEEAYRERRRDKAMEAEEKKKWKSIHKQLKQHYRNKRQGF